MNKGLNNVKIKRKKVYNKKHNNKIKHPNLDVTYRAGITNPENISDNKLKLKLGNPN